VAVTPQQVAKLRADAAMLKAQKARMREQLAAGQLVRKEGSNRAMFMEARRVRDAILSAPARYGAELAAELDAEPWLLLQALNRTVRKTLALACDTGPFPEPAPIPGMEKKTRDGKGRFVRGVRPPQTPLGRV
jgi:hypothetical protein